VLCATINYDERDAAALRRAYVNVFQMQIYCVVLSVALLCHAMKVNKYRGLDE
jgi:hypothetical protein